MAVNASHVSVVARAARVRGRLTGDGDLEIRGYVEGDIAVGGEVTVEAEGLVAAPVHARRVVVRGAVKGDLVAEESIVIESGGRVVGDLKAPRIALADGALVRGFVQTADDGAGAAHVARASAARPVSASAGRAAPAARPAAAAPRAQTRVAPKVDAAPSPEPSPANRALLRRPPPPVVPALKKMRGQIVKKKER